MSMDLLIEKIIEKNNPTVVGLDPKLSYVPKFIQEESFENWGMSLEGAAKAILAFNKAIIDAVSDIVPAVKPQSAYYEMVGFPGIKTLWETVSYAREKGLYVILDGKRNDIGATSEAYATAYLGETKITETRYAPAFFADSLTVNGYLGSDGINPFLDQLKHGKSIFALVKTSNPSSGELQDLILSDGTKVYEKMADLVEGWGEDFRGKYGYSSVGAVVGATYPEELSALRKRSPHTFFLVPGYGAQGGGAKDVAGAFDENGLGGIINSSRGILCAYQKTKAPEVEFAAAARAEAIRMRDELNCCR